MSDSDQFDSDPFGSDPLDPENPDPQDLDPQGLDPQDLDLDPESLDAEDLAGEDLDDGPSHARAAADRSENLPADTIGSENIDSLLNSWPFDPETVNVRIARGDDGRELLQMRIDLGVLQMEMEGRPDGQQPFGLDSYLDYLISESISDSEMKLTDDQCDEVDREFIQYYHRRICWLKLQRYANAVSDADHTLALMDFCTKYSPEEQWAVSHEQYRPFVLFHRTQAAALHSLDGGGAEAAITEINAGLDKVRQLFQDHDLEEFFEENELVVRLIEFRESLRDEYEVGKTLRERLADAVASEEYELAAQLRDEISRQRRGL